VQVATSRAPSGTGALAGADAPSAPLEPDGAAAVAAATPAGAPSLPRPCRTTTTASVTTLAARRAPIPAALATFAFAVLSSSASAAEYYIVQDRDTKTCKVVETRPTETTWIQVGPLAFKTQDEADRQLKVICKETR
jgi:hypothetical protein